MHLPTSDFVTRMDSYWTSLNLCSSPALRQAWSQLADAFNQHILGHDDLEQRNRWTVLQPPTGSGKSQGTALYAAMLARFETPETHPGMLIVTERIDQVNEMVSTINRLLDRAGYACGFHSQLPKGSQLTLDQLATFPVVVITHKAYENALESRSSFATTWSSIHEWGEGERRLVVVDECLEPLVGVDLDLAHLRHVLYHMPPEIRQQETHARAIEAIRVAIDFLQWLEADPETLACERMAPAWSSYGDVDMDSLIEEVSCVPWDRVLLGHEDLPFRKKAGSAHCKTLKALEEIFRSPWAFYSKVGSRRTVQSSRLLVAAHLKGAVVLDATAGSNLIYELFDQADRQESPVGVRSYANVTLHVSKGHSVGKSLKDSPDALIVPVLRDLKNRLGSKPALLLTHLNAEEIVTQKKPAAMHLEIAHWGAVTGSNAWQDLDTAIVLGLPRRPEQWATASYMALQGPQTTEWLQAPTRPFRDHEDVRQAMLVGQTISDLAQGINRIRCRKVVDEQGNCLPCDVYLALGSGVQANQVLEGLFDLMPDIKMVDWDLELDVEPAKRGRKGVLFEKVCDEVLRFLTSASPGRFDKAAIRQAVVFRDKAWEMLTSAARDQTSSLFPRLRALGVTLEHRGAGRSPVFVKG